MTCAVETHRWVQTLFEAYYLFFREFFSKFVLLPVYSPDFLMVYADTPTH